MARAPAILVRIPNNLTHPNTDKWASHAFNACQMACSGPLGPPVFDEGCPPVMALLYSLYSTPVVHASRLLQPVHQSSLARRLSTKAITPCPHSFPKCNAYFDKAKYTTLYDSASATACKKSPVWWRFRLAIDWSALACGALVPYS